VELSPDLLLISKSSIRAVVLPGMRIRMNLPFGLLLGSLGFYAKRGLDSSAKKAN